MTKLHSPVYKYNSISIAGGKKKTIQSLSLSLALVTQRGQGGDGQWTQMCHSDER